MSKHTKGPLKADGRDIWKVGEGYQDPQRPHVYLGSAACDCPECKANARLWAASPDLLDALKALVDSSYYPNLAPSDAAWKQAEAAIAKAEGVEA